MGITMEDIDKRLTKVEHNTTKILFYLESDDTTKSKGIVEMVNDTDKRVKLLELERKIEKVRSGIYGVLGGSVIIVVWFVIKEWIKHNVVNK